MKIVQSLVSMTLGAAILVLAANQFAPGWAAELRSLVQRGQEWSEQAIRSDPVGFLETTRDRLMDERNRLDELVRELRASMGPLDGHIEQLASELAKTEAFLREGRIALQSPLDELLEETRLLIGPEALLAALPRAGVGVEVLSRRPGRWLVRRVDEAALAPGLVAQRASLEDLFEALT